jgi:hypothetical protein
MYILHVFDTMQSGAMHTSPCYKKSDLEAALDDFFLLFATVNVYTTNSLNAVRTRYAEALEQYTTDIFCNPIDPWSTSNEHPMTVGLNKYKETLCILISAAVSLYLKDKLLDDMHIHSSHARNLDRDKTF